MAGRNSDRYGQAFYGLDGAELSVTSLVLSEALYAILAGTDPKAIECFVDVTVGGVAVPYLESITIERGLSDQMGTCRLTVLCTSDAVPAGIAENAAVIVTAGVKFGTGTASQQVFAGRVDNWTPPDRGKIRGTLTAYDDAKRMDDDTVSGTMSGDLATWLGTETSTLSMGSTFSIVQKGAAVTIPTTYSLTGFRSLLDAAKAMVSALDMRYLFFSGAGDLVLFDPDYADDTADPQFTFDRVISFREMANTSQRFNRIGYSNYIGYAHDFVTFTLTVNPGGANSIQASEISTVAIISGTYNDAEDQAIYGILDLPGGVQNNICATDGELSAYAASVAAESQRSKFSLSVRFNPFLELGQKHLYGTTNGFVGRLRHNLTAGQLWTSDVEFWEATA